MVLSPVVVLGIHRACRGGFEAFGSDKASGKGLRSGASCLEVLQKRSSAAAGGGKPFKAQRKQRNFDLRRNLSERRNRRFREIQGFIGSMKDKGIYFFWRTNMRI